MTIQAIRCSRSCRPEHAFMIAAISCKVSTRSRAGAFCCGGTSAINGACSIVWFFQAQFSAPRSAARSRLIVYPPAPAFARSVRNRAWRRDLSDRLELDRNAFLLAVLEQRLPMLDFQALVDSRPAAGEKHEKLINQSETIGGRPLSALADDLLDLIKECVADKYPRSRWFSLDELPVVALIRQLRPTFRSQGLTQADQKKVLEALR